MPSLHEPSGRVTLAALLACAATLTSCLNHYLVHPTDVPPRVITWSEEARRGGLLIHLEWARPVGSGPFPAVLVHAEAGHTALDMRGVLWDLAGRGYLAVAADYRRLIRGKYRRNLFAWREGGDVTAALDILRSHPGADGTRLATLGFSQGGVFSLLIAAHAPEIRAVVAYYPVTDFIGWLYGPQTSPMRRLGFHFIRSYFRRQSGARDDEHFQRMLIEASPLRQAGQIRAPVLLIHGNCDRSAPLEESGRLAARLRELGRSVELLVIPDAEHVFNFKDVTLARRSWEATVAWLARYLGEPGGRLDLPPFLPIFGIDGSCGPVRTCRTKGSASGTCGGPRESIVLPSPESRLQNGVRVGAGSLSGIHRRSENRGGERRLPAGRDDETGADPGPAS